MAGRLAERRLWGRRQQLSDGSGAGKEPSVWPATESGGPVELLAFASVSIGVELVAALASLARPGDLSELCVVVLEAVPGAAQGRHPTRRAVSTSGLASSVASPGAFKVCSLLLAHGSSVISSPVSSPGRGRFESAAFGLSAAEAARTPGRSPPPVPRVSMTSPSPPSNAWSRPTVGALLPFRADAVWLACFACALCYFSPSSPQPTSMSCWTRPRRSCQLSSESKQATPGVQLNAHGQGENTPSVRRD